ncbi:MAG TPA: hypothetical protein VG963_27280 [Polyangiaceae bacterium]|nr:hypothetical protein [Polyangiaceae bacterium]
MIVMIAVIVVVVRLLALPLALPAIGRAPLLFGTSLLFGAVLGLAPFCDTALVGALLSFSALGFVPRGFAVLGLAPFFEATLLGTVFGLAALGFVPFCFPTFLVTPLFGTTLGLAPFFDVLVPSVTGVVAHIGRSRAHAIFAQLGRLFSEHHPVAIRPIIPAPIHEIRGAAVIVSVRVIFDAGRRLHVLDGIAVHHLAARMRHAAGQRSREQDRQT